MIRLSDLSLSRRFGVGLIGVAALGLLPWIGYLAATLPATYTAQSWNLTWVVFDAALLTLLAVTALLAVLRHRSAPLTGFATGVMLLCDAWFDTATSARADHLWAVATAALIEIPMAAFLIAASARSLSRVVADPAA